MSIYAYDMGREDGRNEEQERIIKLIEELREFMVKARQSGDVDILLAEEHYKRLIALIKGENK